MRSIFTRPRFNKQQQKIITDVHTKICNNEWCDGTFKQFEKKNKKLSSYGTFKKYILLVFKKRLPNILVRKKHKFEWEMLQ